jgi:peptide/nickel transport system substrate-binding protein
MQNLPNFKLFLTSLLAALVLTGVVALSACSGIGGAAPTPTSLPTPTSAPTATPEPPAGNLTVRMAEDIPRLRPWQPRSRSEEQMISLLYSGLVRLDDELRPQPDLASEWETTADGRVLTFTLRSGLTWHDGQPLDGEDVLFTLERLRSLPFTSTALLANLRYIQGVTVPTSNTVVLSLTERYAPLLPELSLPILPRHILQGRNLESVNFWEEPVGSGPFQFGNRVPGQSVVLTRYENYHHGAPRLDRVAFVGAPDPNVALEALNSENLLLAEMPWSSMSTLSDISAVRTGYYPENGFYYLGFNLRDGRPFADMRVRQALAAAINVPRLVEAATNGQGIPLGSSAAPGSWADLTPPPEPQANLEEARRLLDEAGWTLPPGSTIRQREGETFTATLYVRGDDERRLVAAQGIAAAAASIGLQINVEPADFETVIVPKYAPPYDFDLILGSWLNGPGDPNFGDYIFYDPDDYALFHSSEIIQSQLDTRNTRNFVAFSDPAYDTQAQAGRQLYDIDERIDAYRRTQERIAEQLPYLYLWTDRIPVALNENVTTAEGPVDLSAPLYMWNIEHWYVEAE